MKTPKKVIEVVSHYLFVVALPDTQGSDCYLAKGAGGDPSRTYLLPYARTYKSERAAKIAIAAAKKTHPFQERTYRVKPYPTNAYSGDQP
jgi:hypothetical protein